MQPSHVRDFLFSPPPFLLLPALGVDISDRTIKYAELLPHRGGHRLGRFGEIPLDEGIVENGRILTPSRLADALKKLSHKHGTSFVRAALPEEQVYFSEMRVPNGTWQEMRDAIELSLEDHVPIPAAEASFDFEVAGTSGADVDVVVTAAARSVVESYADTFRQAELTLLSLELEGEAVTRAVVHPDDMSAYLIVDFGRTRTGIAVVYGGKIHFTSTVEIGGQMLTDTLRKHFNVTAEEAESMKREFGMRRNSPHQDLFSLLLNNIAVLRDEINKHFVYWHGHASDGGMSRPPITGIILVGGDSNLAGLSEYLSASLHVPTALGNVWNNVGLSAHDVPELSRKDSLGYATAIGLALHDVSSEILQAKKKA